jgi:hygromycin-B 7''-O-kinase
MKPLLFPAVTNLDEYEQLRRDDHRFRPGALAICDTLGLRGQPIERFPGGSLPVYAVGDTLVLKLYPPFERIERDREAAALSATAGRLPIPTPGVRATGELEGWPYLLMDRLPGRDLSEAWPGLSPDERMAMASQLGEALAALHAIQSPSLDPLRIDWAGFLDEQTRTAAERQRARGLDERWCEQIPDFLQRAQLEAAPPDGGSLLHTEIMREHLLVEPGEGGWRLSGLFDFEPAMVGATEYEFVAVGLFFSGGEPALLRRVLLAYGCPEHRLDASFTLRLMAGCLLHRYGNVSAYLRLIPPPAGARTLRDLAETWWGLSA